MQRLILLRWREPKEEGIEVKWDVFVDERYREAQFGLRRSYPMMVNKARAD